jgi:hypothetical protein
MPVPMPTPDHLPAPGPRDPWSAADPQLAEDAWLDQPSEPPPWLAEYPEPEDPRTG